MGLSATDNERPPILMVCQMDPWGEQHGARMRLQLIFDALRRLGPVDLVVITEEPIPPDRTTPRGVRRALYLKAPRPKLSRPRRAWWLVRGGSPLEFSGRDYSEVRQRVAEWLAPQYGLVFTVRSRSLYALLPVLPAAPIIVDLDDLEAAKVAGQVEALPPPGGVRQWPRALFERLLLRRNIGRWEDFDERMARAADVAIVCSDADAEQVAGARVVPNGYRLPDRTLGQTPVGSPPSMLLQGALTYEPNADGATWLVHEVLPLIQNRIPDVQLRLVGQAYRRVQALHSPPQIEVTGFVPDLDPELSRCDLVVVPLRYGGGTRIKILEALAHRIPVVSTSAGAYGLGLIHEEHVMIADDAATFADACVRLLGDEDLRQRLARAGRLHVERHYADAVVVGRLLEVVGDVAPGLVPERSIP